jgi:tetratricopeptide (TPR) repeat protein
MIRRFCRRDLLIAGVWLGSLATAHWARAEAGGAEPPLNADTRALFDLGLAAYESQQYQSAIEILQQVAATSPRLEVLYALAQAYRLSGDCAKAIRTYKLALSHRPKARQGKVIESNIVACEAKLKEPSAQAAAGSVDTGKAAPERAPARLPEPEPVVPSVATDEQLRPFATNWVGHSLGALGVVGLGFSIGFIVAEQEHLRTANQATSYGQFDQDINAANRARQAWVAFGSAGLLLVSGAVAAYLLWTEPNVPLDASAFLPIVAPVIGPNGAGCTAEWRL